MAASDEKRLRDFARHIYDQLGRGPRTNGISKEFCAQLGREAAKALRVPHVCFNVSTEHVDHCDDPECPLRKGGG